MSIYLDNLNSAIYSDYLVKLDLYNNLKKKILKKGSDETKYYNEDTNNYYVKYNNIELTIQKPIYKNVFNEMNNIKIKKKNLLIDYHNLRYKIIHDLNNKSDFDKYNSIVLELKDYDERLKELIEYYINANKINRNEREKNNNEINKLREEKNKLYSDILEEKDSLLNKKYINDYLDLINSYYEKQNYYEKTIDFYIEELPNIEEKNVKIEKPKTNKKEKTKKEKTDDEIEKEKLSKLKEKIKNKLNNTPQEKLDKLEDNVKREFLKLFKFKNKKECSSRSYKSDSFMKKPDIIKIISRSKDIEKRLPSNYQSFSKEKICEELYKL